MGAFYLKFELNLSQCNYGVNVDNTIFRFD